MKGLYPLLIFMLVCSIQIKAQTTYTVDITFDENDGSCSDGDCSLRDAIILANSDAINSIIVFALGTGSMYSVGIDGTTYGNLPALTEDNTFIDGFTNYGNHGSANTVELFNASGSTPLDFAHRIKLVNSGLAAITTGISIQANGCIIQGLVIPDVGTSADNLTDIGINIQGNGNFVHNCLIGVDETATSPNTNMNVGIRIRNGSGNIIGGEYAETDHINIIGGQSSTSSSYGVYLTGSSTGNYISYNMIGLKKNGETINGSMTYGIYLSGVGCSGNFIGGEIPTIGSNGNVISGCKYGIWIEDCTQRNNIKGNIVGLRANGTNLVASSGQIAGISIINSSNQYVGEELYANSVGINVLSGNTTYGIYISGATSSGNIITQSYIGCTLSGGAIGGSGQDYGIYITGACCNQIGANTIPPSSSTNLVRNIIRGNTANGIYITGAAATANLITRNIIYSNTGDGIELVSGGNAAKTAPTITAFSTNSISGTSEPSDTIEVFKNNTGNCQDAQSHLGSVLSNSITGNWSITTVTLSNGESVTATARNISNNNTSEFSSSCLVGLPIELIFFVAKVITQHEVQLTWETASETNNDFFTVERSRNGIDFEKIKIVDGTGNSSQSISYTAYDQKPFKGTSYYRLKQTDFDSNYRYSNIISVLNNDFGMDFNIFPNPIDNENIHVTISGLENEEVSFSLYSAYGIEVFHTTRQLSSSEEVLHFDINTQLPSGVYFFSASTATVYNTLKLVVE